MMDSSIEEGVTAPEKDDPLASGRGKTLSWENVNVTLHCKVRPNRGLAKPLWYCDCFVRFSYAPQSFLEL